MRDYDELVKRLQDFAAGTMRDEDAQTAFDAIDAIVELQKCVEAEYQSGFADGQISANRKKSKWISVEDALPKNELETYWVYTSVGSQHSCRWTNNRFGLVVSDKWGWSVFDIPQYTVVTHWMELPKQPEEYNSG